MAKKDAQVQAQKTQAPVTTVTIADLTKETGIDAKKIRATIRSLGMKAPEVKQESGTFGPKAKYEWMSNSPDLAKIREALKNPPKREDVPKNPAKGGDNASKNPAIDGGDDDDD